MGIAEYVPVKVGDHLIHIDFVVLEVEEREKPPLILGRPFLKTVMAKIDVGKGEIKFNVNGTKSVFNFCLQFEVCDMINVKYVPHHRHISKEEPKKKEAREITEVVASVETKK
jgi:hypothetical protein